MTLRISLKSIKILNLKLNKTMKNVNLSIIVICLTISLSMTGQEQSVVKSIDNKTLEWGGCPLPMDCNVTVLHGDISKSNADVFFKIPSNTEIPLHSHKSAERMVLISGKLEIIYEGEEKNIVKAGSYMYGPPNKPHRGKCISKKPCVIFIAFNEPVDAKIIE